MKKGFTLVELSIVLVIIGLLIGGILVAKSMISSSRVTRQIQQIQQFDAAVANFQTKYSTVPGDSPALGCPPGSVAGFCGDGYIEDGYWEAGNSAIWFFNMEVANFWPQLQQIGFGENGVTYIPGTAGGFNVTSASRNSPQSILDKNSGFVVGTTIVSPMGYGTNLVTVYQLADHSKINSDSDDNIEYNDVQSISGADALALDTKMDDGKPNTGRVYAAAVNNYAGNGFYFGQADDILCAGAAADAYQPNAKCAIDIQVLGQSGGSLH